MSASSRPSGIAETHCGDPSAEAGCHHHFGKEVPGMGAKGQQTRRAGATFTVATVLAAFIAVLVPATPAQANHSLEQARWHDISGDVYSNTNWYVSQNIRYKGRGTLVTAKFSNLIGGSKLRFCVHNRTCSDFDTTGNEQQVNTIPAGTHFQNSFRRLTSCSGCDHHFVGEEWY
jgi:hypothetical protein